MVPSSTHGNDRDDCNTLNTIWEGDLSFIAESTRNWEPGMANERRGLRCVFISSELYSNG